MENRKATEYNELVGISKDGGLVILEEIFSYGENGLKGATGYIMETLTQDQIDLARSEEQLKEYWQDAVANNMTEASLDEWVEGMNENYNDENGYFYGDDPSFRELTNEIYSNLSDEDKAVVKEHIGEKGKDFVDFDCQSCGRCMLTDHKDYSVLLRPDLLEKIIAVEK